MSTTIPSDRDILVCIFQRGAADGLNSVVPYGDADYALQRNTIAVPAPGMPAGAIDLDGFFGLHSALAPLKPIYDAGDLAFVHATGVPHGSRSHFAAQGLIERGVDDKAGPNTGWLGRHLGVSSPAANSAFRSVAISGNVPVTLSGAEEPLAISDLSEYGFDEDITGSGYPELLANMYRPEVPFSGTAAAALTAIDELAAANLAGITPGNGATYPDSSLGKKMQQAGQLIYSELPVEVICVDSDGWDHHENLPFFLNQSLTDLAASLEAFYTDMGDQMQRITVLVHTEFGRRVKENASVGTDHGTGSVAFVMGGGVNGGQVIRDWPGLADEDLEQGDDLQITIDLRSVLNEMLSKRLGGTNTSIVFPDFADETDYNIFSS